MEFRFRAGDRRPRNPSPALFSGLCDQRFPPQAGPFHGDLSPPPAFDWEAAAWRERLIREEVERRLIRVEVERRLIEEEVRRELAVATARFHGGFGPVPFVGPDGPLVPPQTPGTFFGHEGPLLPLPPAMFFGHDGPLLPPVPLPLMPVDMHQNCPPPASFAEWERVDRSVGFEQSVLVKRPLPPPKRKHKLELCEIKPPKRKHKLKQCEIKPPKPKRKLKLSGIEPSKSSEIHSPETKVSGVKRKADVISATTEPTELVSETTEPTELQNEVSATTEPKEVQNAARHRSCALCQVIANTKADLKQHLRGRRHLAKLVLQNEVSATTEPKEVQNAARHRSCALCQVIANTKADLKQHLRGRRHLAKLVHSGSITLIDDDKSGLEEITGNDNGAGPSDDAPREIHVLINGAIHEVVYKNGLLSSTTIKPTELQNAISETIEPAKVQNVTFATTEPTEVQNAARYSSFAPSQVGATSKVNLKKYRKGRRHLKRKLHSYGLSAVASGAGPSDAPKKIHILVDGAMHEVVQQGGFVRCERCGVKCVNAGLMADHLRGKKHSLLNKVWRAIKDVRMKNKSKQDSAASC